MTAPRTTRGMVTSRLFTVHLTIGNGHHHIDYKSIDECLADKPLSASLDAGHAEVVLWAGAIRITGTPITSSVELRQALVENAKTILMRLL